MTFGAQSASASGWTVSVKPYSGGEAGIRQSLQEVTRLMRLAKDDPRIKRWAVETLAARGIDGRNRPSIRQQAQALLDAFRAQTIYVPDSAGAEHVQAAHITLCLGDQCIPGEDCESLCLALGGAMLSIGLPAYAVRVDYGSDYQQHLVLGLTDETGNKFYVDPSTNKPILDSIPGAVDLDWVDPLDQAGTLGAVGAEIVTLGAVASMLTRRVSRETPRKLFLSVGVWHEYRHGKWWTHSAGRWSAGLGSQPFARGGRWWVSVDGTEAELTEAQAGSMGLGAAPSVTTQTPYQQVTDNQVHTGLRYRLGMQLTFNQDPSIAIDTQALLNLFSDTWFIESFDAQAPATATASGSREQTYVLQGIAKADQTLADTNTSVGAVDLTRVSVGIKYLAVGVQSATSTPATTAIVPISPSTPADSNNVSFIAASLAAAVAGGIGYSLWKRYYRG
jgi:hypothetical protein